MKLCISLGFIHARPPLAYRENARNNSTGEFKRSYASPFSIAVRPFPITSTLAASPGGFNKCMPYTAKQASLAPDVVLQSAELF